MRLFLFLLLLTPLTVLSQLNGRVIHADSQDPIAFVSVVNERYGRGVVTDIDGVFSLPANPGDTLRFTFVGFETLKIPATQNMEVVLSPEAVKLQAAEVNPGLNPAIPIMEQVIAKRKINAPEGNFSFKYDAYNKLVFTGQLDSAYQNNPEKMEEISEDGDEFTEMLERQHLFLLESITERKYLSEGRETEKIKASKVSGLDNANFGLLASQLQSFNFYKNEVQLLGENFLSPIAPSALSRYVFSLEDSTFTETDTVYVIAYQLKKGKTVKGLKGLLYVNKSDHALQNVIASPNVPLDGFDIRIRQKFEKVEGHWFPKQLNSLLELKTVESPGFEFYGIGRTYISNVEINPDLSRKDIGYLSVSSDPNAGSQPDSLWAIYRDGRFDAKDSLTYHVLDSIGDAEKLDEKLALLQSLFTGRIPIRKVNVDLRHVLKFNSYETVRLGLGLETNEKWHERWQLHGRAGYGFKDKEWKYGGGLIRWFNKKANSKIEVHAEQEVVQRGGQFFNRTGSFLSTSDIYHLYVDQMDQRGMVQLRGGSKLPGWLEFEAGVTIAEWKTTQDYADLVELNENVTERRTYAQELVGSLKLRWSFREKIVETGRGRVVFQSPFPIVQLNVEQAMSDVWGDLDYTRIGIQIDQSFRLPSFGTTTMRLLGGMVTDAPPVYRQFTVRGTGVNRTLASRGVLETLPPQSVFTPRYAALSVEHSFKDLLFTSKFVQPGISLVHNLAFAEEVDGNHENLETTNLESGHYEAGVIISNLIKLNTAGYGVGFFANYNDGDGVNWKSDVFVKLNVNVAF
ncbi:MAG: carboxypeptidase-like regulatory domain-containing protein [Flavobacteriales bacterium]|nr:carboxypeptidase-like regulatory domain-containing protein [Flavobacteriales bacterium]